MALYNNNLYSRIIENEALLADELNVISGYASANFLKKVKINFPNMKIKIFIGMYLDGISLKDHLLFKKIMKDYQDVEIYYQIEGKQTHTKLIEFSNLEKNQHMLDQLTSQKMVLLIIVS